MMYGIFRKSLFNDIDVAKETGLEYFTSIKEAQNIADVFNADGDDEYYVKEVSEKYIDFLFERNVNIAVANMMM